MKLILLYYLPLMLIGCSNAPPPGHRDVYVAINEVLIEKGRCKSLRDCQDKSLVFWEGGHNRMYFNIYSSCGAGEWLAIESAVIKVKRNSDISRPIKLSFFREKKSETLKSGLNYTPVYTKEIL